MEEKKYSPRSDGVIMLCMSIVCGYLGIYKPLNEIRNSESLISMPGILILFLPLLIGEGAIYTILGPKAEKLFGELRSQNRAGKVLRFVYFGLGIGLFLWMESIRIKRGYR